MQLCDVPLGVGRGYITRNHVYYYNNVEKDKDGGINKKFKNKPKQDHESVHVARSHQVASSNGLYIAALDLIGYERLM